MMHAGVAFGSGGIKRLYQPLQRTAHGCIAHTVILHDDALRAIAISVVEVGHDVDQNQRAIAQRYTQYPMVVVVILQPLVCRYVVPLVSCLTRKRRDVGPRLSETIEGIQQDQRSTE